MRSERRFACCGPVRNTTPDTGKKWRYPGGVAASPRAAAVGVDVLDVPCATTTRHAAYSGDGVQGPTGEPRWPAWRCNRCRAPHRPSRLWQDDQRAGLVGGRHAEVCSLPGTVARDQHRNLFIGKAPLAACRRDAVPDARSSRAGAGVVGSPLRGVRMTKLGFSRLPVIGNRELRGARRHAGLDHVVAGARA